MDLGRKLLVDFSARKTQLVLFDQSNNTGAIDVKMDGFVHKEKSPFKMLGLTFSCKLDWGSYIISIAKTAPKKIGALSCSMKFLSQNVVCLSLFYSYYFGRCSSELTQLVPPPFSQASLLVILRDSMIFLSPFLDITRMPMSTVSFLADLDRGILCL